MAAAAAAAAVASDGSRWEDMVAYIDAMPGVPSWRQIEDEVDAALKAELDAESEGKAPTTSCARRIPHTAINRWAEHLRRLYPRVAQFIWDASGGDPMLAYGVRAWCAIERPLTRERQAVMDKLDAFCHPSERAQRPFVWIVDNPLPRRAGFTSLLCDWIARKSHTGDVIAVECAFSQRQTRMMEGMVQCMGGDMQNLVFLHAEVETDSNRPLPSIAVRVTMHEVEVEFEGEPATIVEERVIIQSV